MVCCLIVRCSCLVVRCLLSIGFVGRTLCGEYRVLCIALFVVFCLYCVGCCCFFCLCGVC